MSIDLVKECYHPHNCSEIYYANSIHVPIDCVPHNNSQRFLSIIPKGKKFLFNFLQSTVSICCARTCTIGITIFPHLFISCEYPSDPSSEDISLEYKGKFSPTCLDISWFRRWLWTQKRRDKWARPRKYSLLYLSESMGKEMWLCEYVTQSKKIFSYKSEMLIYF